MFKILSIHFIPIPTRFKTNPELPSCGRTITCKYFIIPRATSSLSTCYHSSQAAMAREEPIDLTLSEDDDNRVDDSRSHEASRTKRQRRTLATDFTDVMVIEGIAGASPANLAKNRDLGNEEELLIVGEKKGYVSFSTGILKVSRS